MMARITPLGPRSMLLETPRRNSWTEHKRGQLATVLKYVEGDTRGTFHGLGSLVAKKRGSKPSVQQILQRDFKVPIRVLAEPEYWYRKPAIAEISDAKDRVLVRFVAHGMMPWEDLADFCARMTEKRKQIRHERGIGPAKTRCLKCGKVSRSDISGVSIRSALFALRNNGVITDDEFKEIDKSWMKHKKKNGLDAHGQKSVSPQDEGAGGTDTSCHE